MDYDFITTCNWTSTGTFTLRAYRGLNINVVTSFTLYYRKKGSSTWNSTANGQIVIDSVGEWEVANDWNKSGNNVLTHSYSGITAIDKCTGAYFNESTLGPVIGNYFLYQCWHDCWNLSSVEGDFTLPQGITSVGNNFFQQCWAYCWSLVSMPDGFNLPQGITTIGHSFLGNCWEDSGLVSMPEGFNLPSDITSTGDWFLAYCWNSCDNLVGMPDDFNLPQGITTVGERFLAGCWQNCGSLVSIPRGFSIPSGVVSVGSGFFEGCWYACTGLSQDKYTEDLIFEFNAEYIFDGGCPIVPDSITGASKENPVRVAVNRPEPPPYRYWVGGSGDWNDTSHWSLSSGGPSGASVPTSDDDVFIDNNSGFNSGGTITALLGVCKGLVLSPGIAVDLGTSQIDIASLQAIGTSDNLISITGGTLSKPSGFVQCDYLNLTNSTATGGAMWYAGEHSVDNGGNVGWRFRKRKYPLPARKV